MTSLQSLLARFKKSATSDRRKKRSRTATQGHSSTENLEQRLLLVNPVSFESNPGAPVTIYLDFDGHTETDGDWATQIDNGTAPIVTPAFDVTGDPAVFDADEEGRIEEIYRRVAEDFLPFDVNVTTIEPPEFRQGRELLVSIGGDGSWTDDDRFIAFFDSYNTGRTQTAFAFSNDHFGLGGAFEQNVAASVSQTIARAMGLSVHTAGDGSRLEGDVDVAPILGDQIIGDDGNSANNNSIRDIWFNAPVNAGSSVQDDLAALDAALNVNFRADDHGDTDLSSTGIAIGIGQEVVTGIIETNSDRDVFSFSTAATTATVSITGLDLRTQFVTAETPGSNLDPLITLRDAAGQILAFNDGVDLTSSFTQALPEGTYFIEVSNKGEYGNLGEYTITIDGVDTLPPFANPVALNSNPGAPIDFYLSFAGGNLVDTHPLLTNRVDGGSGNVTLSTFDLDGNAAAYSAAEVDAIIEIYERVAEDFAPFNVNVTTVRPANLADGTALEVIIGDHPAFDPGFGWHSLLGAFSDNQLPNNAVVTPSVIAAGTLSDGKSIAFQVSSAIGSMLGLGEHPEYAPDGSVQNQFDPGTSAVGPILGAPFNSLRDIWVNAAGNVSDVLLQDDLQLITSAANGIQFRGDDFANDVTTARAVDIGIGDEIINGIIETNDDVDVFQVDTLATTATFSVTGLDLTSQFSVPNPGSNLDPVLRIFDSRGLLVGQSDIPFSPANPNVSLTASVTAAVPAGRYFIEISNRGEYGNLGQYTLTIEGIDAVPVTVSVDPSSFAETDGLQVGVGRVNRPAGASLSGSIVVDLQTSEQNLGADAELTVPAQVVIPAGSTSASFDIMINDDQLLDGDQRIAVEALVSGVVNSRAFVTVTDVETIEVSLDPNPVAESSGTASLTVRRSNEDFQAVNHWLTNDSQILEYSPAGVLQTTIDVPWPTGGLRPPGQTLHDVTVLEDGRLAVFNGTDNATLSVYNIATDTWEHFGPINGLSGLGSDETIGGIASSGDYVFLSDFETITDDERGMVRINLVTGEIDRFASGTLGSRLFALGSGFSRTVIEINPSTGETINSFNLPQIPGDIGGYLGEAIAFDGTNLWIIAFRGQTGFYPLIKVDPNTGELLEEHSLAAAQSFFHHEGLAYLDGRIFLKELFDGGTEAYNPETRRFEAGIVDLAAVNGTSFNAFFSSVPGEERLVFTGGINSNSVFEVDLLTNQVVSTFSSANLVRSNPGISTTDDVTYGDTVFNDLIFVASASNRIDVFTRSGQQVDVDPSTVAIDSIMTEATFTGDIAAADVPGVSSLDLSFRDVTIGLDGLVYGLTDSGDHISVHDPESLIRLRGIDLDQTVQTIAISDDSGIYAGASDGELIVFDFDGVTVSSITTTLVNIADIEVNIGQEVIVSDAGGTVLLTNQSAIQTGDNADVQILESTGTTGFVSFGRHPTRSTGDLVVTLTSSDISELSVPVEVTIPAGQQEIVIDVDVIDDNLRDGNQVVTVTAASPEYTTGSTDVTVLDSESVSVEVVPDDVSEDAGEVADAVIVRRSDTDGPFLFQSTFRGSVTGPIDILDDDVILSTIEVPSQVSRVTDVNVTLSIQHEAIPDLDVFLISPSGTRVELFTDLSSNETTIRDTVLDDEAATLIINGNSPYTGRFRPERPLSILDGQNPSGSWTLEVIDDNGTDVGVLLGWGLEIATAGLAPLQVTLGSSDETEATVQTTVTIPGNQAEVRIPLTAIDDDILDGTQIATIDVVSAPVSDSFGDFALEGDSVNVVDAENIVITVETSELSEAATNPATTGTITRTDNSTATDLVVSLTSSDLSELTVPATVTIPAGSSFATFDISVVDDQDFDGDQLVTISATAAGFLPSVSDPITVRDREPRLTMSTVTPTVAEDAGTVVVTLARVDADDLGVPQEVSLVSSSPGDLVVPATVTIPAGEFSTSFVATIVDNAIVDGTRTVSITASDADTQNKVVNDATLDITIEDAEYLSLSVASGVTSFAENSGTNVLQVTVSLTAAQHTLPLFVTLTNSDVTEASVPRTVIIPTGESSATFFVSAVDDVVIDGAQDVRITASLENFISGSLDLTVTDHEPPLITGPASVTEDPTPSITWAPLTGAVRYDLWVNDVSRGITQLFRHENLSAGTPLIAEDFESSTFDSAVWASVTDVDIDGQAMNDPSGTVSAHFNGGPNGTDLLQSATMDLSGMSGVQLTYSFQKKTNRTVVPGTTPPTNSPVAGQDLVFSYRNADGFWIQLSRQLSVRPDISHFETVRLDLPDEALHSEFALRIESFGPVDDDDPATDPPSTSWFVDYVELTPDLGFTPTQELGVGRYRFWVRGFDELNQPTAWSRGTDFQIVTRPEIVAPTNKSFVSTIDFPEVSWTSVVDTTYYDLWINNITTGESKVVRETRLPTTSYATELDNLPGGAYRAWTRATVVDQQWTAELRADALAENPNLTPAELAEIEALVYGRWSAPVNFTVLSTPTDLAPSTPTFNRRPELTWSKVEGASNYYVWLARRTPGEDPQVILRDRFVEGTSRVPNTDLEDGTYVFWVQALSADGTPSRWSAAQTFSVNGNVTVDSPVNGSVVETTTPTFQWSTITGTARYEVWVNRIDVPERQSVYDPNVVPSSYRVETPLVSGGTYRLWVRAVSEMGEFSFWSFPVTFSVADSGAQSEDNATSVTFYRELEEPAHTMTDAVALSSTSVETADASPDVEEAQKSGSVEVSHPVVAVDVDVVDSTDVEQIDSVMEELAVADWFVESGKDDAEASEASAAALAFGLMSSGTLVNRKRDRRRKR